MNKVSCNIFFPKLIDFKDFYKTKADIIGFSRSGKLSNQGKPITEDVKLNIQKFFQSLDGHKKEKICKTAEYFKRGKFSISRIINSISE
ncbi:hypothetical protein FACS1894166_11300 [Bacilli bacterium]|nr:hypothetical protein FACS1894166_11300 [Bacilli bacterium]